jgi:hypothetical protein
MIEITGWMEEYRDGCKDLVRSFIKEYMSEYASYNDDYISGMFEKNKDTTLFLLIDGKLSGVISGSLIKSVVDDSCFLQELIWYSYPHCRRGGLKLLYEFEKMGKRLGAKSIVMAHLCNDKAEKLEKLYTHLQYIPLEKQYIKVISA